ncbi:uncharacterized protein L969DRAFT_45875 [Mixia osmundae IAM 14324]|uniref:Xylanolytic transcriptional activator regulatory domain-containing protein n=1 Tax=Mixia osmundae (strain CBS 9802 / IAM 14324 / JCM 22182 / KY 12970) TaxID=764103 RepID=G7E5R2_MIXOS|nr:uncharacterized protein L969DRAFT_45875 [Mixia osmundae IAM 14324]KEI40678.1 hypothetical protein L969DRAFT_45875 [Mixia osmundae IAM 14324]GAA98172.1 hypothetical protein E5Q_04855 [Mixia osmundae IAM 14324]
MLEWHKSAQACSATRAQVRHAIKSLQVDAIEQDGFAFTLHKVDHQRQAKLSDPTRCKHPAHVIKCRPSMSQQSHRREGNAIAKCSLVQTAALESCAVTDRYPVALAYSEESPSTTSHSTRYQFGSEASTSVLRPRDHSQRPELQRAGRSQPALLTTTLPISSSRGSMSAPPLLNAPWSSPEAFEQDGLPEGQARSSMLDSYFANVNTVLPLIHVPQYQRDASSDPYFHRQSFKALSLSMLALGGLSNHQTASTAAKCSEAARELLFNRQDAFDLGWLTASTLMLFYAISTRSPGASYLLAYTSKAAIQNGIHRDDEPRWTGTLREHELRKRIWWSLAMADLLLASPLQAIALVNPRMATFELPLPIDDVSLDLGQDQQAASAIVDAASSGLSMLRFNEFLRRTVIAGDALAAVRLGVSANNLLLAQHSVANMDADEAGLAGAASDDDSDRRYTAIFRAVLRIIVHRSLMACTANTGADSTGISRQIVTSAARQIRHNVDVLVERNEHWPLLGCFVAIADQNGVTAVEARPSQSALASGSGTRQQSQASGSTDDDDEDLSDSGETVLANPALYQPVDIGSMGSPGSFFAAGPSTPLPESSYSSSIFLPPRHENPRH